MAIIHPADIRPTKLELIRDWLPGQQWYDGESPVRLEAVGAYRFDDPDGEVGIETHLVRTGEGDLVQVPLTYRGAPLAGGDATLVGMMEHSVLGTRWVYDGCGDPVYVTALAAAVLEGVPQAAEIHAESGERREPTVLVSGTGFRADLATGVATAIASLESSTADGVTVFDVADTQLRLRRRLTAGQDHRAEACSFALTGTWAGQQEPAVLATARAV